MKSRDRDVADTPTHDVGGGRIWLVVRFDQETAEDVAGDTSNTNRMSDEYNEAFDLQHALENYRVPPKLLRVPQERVFEGFRPSFNVSAGHCHSRGLQRPSRSN